MDVLVTDADENHALSAVRSLGKGGLTVGAAADSRWAKSFYSRYCKKSIIYTAPETSISGFHHDLHKAITDVKPAFLMPMTERVLLALMQDWQAIEKRVRLTSLPSKESLEIAFDKGLTIELAKSHGISVPGTWIFSQLPDFVKISSQLNYPVVIKPRTSQSITPDGRVLPHGTVEYCYHASEFKEKYLNVHKKIAFPLVQEFVPGEGYGICVLCKYGQIKALFAHRRLRTVNPTGSGSSLRESITPPPDMLDAARVLLEALQWHGVAMVEFKRDSRDGSPRLMEINGRFWNSLPLAVAAGVNFPRMLYTLSVTGDVRECLQYRTGVKCRWLAGDIMHLIRVLRGRPAGWQDHFPSRGKTLINFLKFYQRDMHYDNMWVSDLLPFIMEFTGHLFHKIPKSLSSGRSYAIKTQTETKARL